MKCTVGLVFIVNGAPQDVHVCMYVCMYVCRSVAELSWWFRVGRHGSELGYFLVALRHAHRWFTDDDHVQITLQKFISRSWRLPSNWGMTIQNCIAEPTVLYRLSSRLNMFQNRQRLQIQSYSYFPGGGAYNSHSNRPP